MRDSNKGMIELLEVSRADDIYAATIRLTIADSACKLRFGIEIPDYKHLRKILQFRPFENTGAGAYRYFFTHSYAHDPADETLVTTAIRVEQLQQHKQFDFTVSRKLLANLIWFRKLENVDPVKTMIVGT